ncbi:MAG: DNA-formamidopyrimidine glycosylase family protein [bacterium]|nr:DNA-formamidopyrimidine glycosylase family protein [bacterium]
MPELPEVETIVRELRKKIIGLKITDFWSDREKPVRQAGGVSKFKKEVVGKKIVGITRRAKFIVVDIEGNKSIFIHQKISGHLMYGQWKQNQNDKSKSKNERYQEWISMTPGPLKNDRENQYIRYIWALSNGYQVAMSDVRRFSRVILVKDKDISNLKEIRDLGPEPLEIKLDEFKNLFKSAGWRKRGNLKPVLMDPFFIVGIGNIYSDEILWDSGYQPLTRVENLKEKDLEKIYKSMLKILKIGIELKGDSMDDYRLPSGEKGGYQNVQKAYQQTGKKCAKKDGGIIQRIRVGGRSAHFCPKHQVRK